MSLSTLTSSDITRKGFRYTSMQIFWYVTLEAMSMWYMYYINWYDELALKTDEWHTLHVIVVNFIFSITVLGECKYKIYNTTTCKCCIPTYPFNSNNAITTVLISLNLDHFNTSSNSKTEVWNYYFSSKLPIYTLRSLLFYGIRVTNNFCSLISKNE